MKKSVYSLILSEEIISKLDSIAYSYRTSRSNYINQVLAEHISYITPEQKIKDILDAVKEFLQTDDRYTFVAMNSNSYMDIRSALNYKYRPSIRYCVELTPIVSGPFCRLKAQVRTQSRSLILDITKFFKLWESIEIKEFFKEAKVDEVCYFNDVCYYRNLCLNVNKNITSEQDLGKAVAEYITTLNSALNVYLENSINERQAVRMVLGIFRRYAETANIIK